MLLKLTSPNMKNGDVRRLQNALVKNVYGSFYSDEVDGVFGEYTANAVRRAKYWLGYSLANINEEAGDLLVLRLEGKSLTTAMRLRRVARLRSASQGTPLKRKALTIATGELGTKESPAGSNVVKYSKWYGMTGPWCMMFVTWAYTKAGATNFDPDKRRWAYCPYVVADARLNRNGLEVVSAANVEPGDLVLYDWDGGDSDHVGLFEAWITRGSEFHAIEGNTSLGNDSNGGEVMRRRRFVQSVECFVRVKT